MKVKKPHFHLIAEHLTSKTIKLKVQQPQRAVAGNKSSSKKLTVQSQIMQHQVPWDIW